MNVCFLDVDGVLNGFSTTELSPEGFTGIDDEKVETLAEFVKKLGMKIVLSSDWRLCKGKDKDYEYLEEKLRQFGLEIADCTPNIGTSFRGIEIYIWLSQHEDVKKYVILDDCLFDFKMCGELFNHVIQTNEKDSDILTSDGIFEAKPVSETPSEEVMEVLTIIKGHLFE